MLVLEKVSKILHNIQYVSLEQVALHITRHDGQPLKSLTSVVFKECLQILTQPGFPDQVSLS